MFAEKHQKINPVVIQCEDFFCFEDGHRSRQSKKVKLPLLSDLCQVEFKKGRRSMLYKTAFDEDAVEVEFFKAPVQPENCSSKNDRTSWCFF